MISSAIARNPNINSNRLRWDIDEFIENINQNIKSFGLYLVAKIASAKLFKHKTERHHIIARIARKAEPARDIFVKKCGRNINDKKISQM